MGSALLWQSSCASPMAEVQSFHMKDDVDEKPDDTESAKPDSTESASAGHYLTHGVERSDAPPENDVSKVPTMKVRHELTRTSSKVILAMVGLPATGKSFISTKLVTFYRWLGREAKIFNVGQARRQTDPSSGSDSSFFDPNNPEAKKHREEMAANVLKELLQWLDEIPGLAVGVFDATNTTVERRRTVHDFILAHNPTYKVIFLESLCEDPDVRDNNVRMKLLKSPDYAGVPYEEAKKDFLQRLAHYEKLFKPVGVDPAEQDLSYIKLINLSSHLVAHRVYGRITTTLLPYVTALHLGRRPVWLIRMPQSVTSAGMGGGLSPTTPAAVRLTVSYKDDSMSEAGQVFAQRLGAYVRHFEELRELRVMVCSHRRAMDCAEKLVSSPENIEVHAALNPMDWGILDGFRRNELQERDPEFWKTFCNDPMGTRFPGGESYGDFVRRLIPVLVEIEQHLEPLAVIAPLSVLQVLHCYFGNIPVPKSSEVRIPQHAIVEWRPDGVGFKQTLVLETQMSSVVSGYLQVPKAPLAPVSLS